jgi:hypothetical protein
VKTKKGAFETPSSINLNPLRNKLLHCPKIPVKLFSFSFHIKDGYKEKMMQELVILITLLWTFAS